MNFGKYIGDKSLIYGPKDGKLDGGLLTFNPPRVVAGCKVRNFVSEVDISNPCSSIIQPTCFWLFGLLFRDTGAGEYYRVYIQNGKNWYFDIATEQKLLKTEAEKPLAEGTLDNFKAAKNDWNSIKLSVLDDTAQFFINQKFIAELDISRKKVRGNISIVNNVLGGFDAFKLKPIRFKDFQVWSLDKD